MRVTAALVAGLGTATTAFLLPPDVSGDLPADFQDTGFHGGPPEHFKEFIHALLEQKTTTVDLECPGCLFAAGEVADAGIAWEQNVDSVVHLEFQTHGNTLNVNNHPLIPLSKAQKAQSSPVKAHQIRKDSNEPSIDLPLNFAMEVMPPHPSPHNDGISLIPIEFTVLGLNGVPMKLNTISLKLIQAPNGDLVIVHHEEIPFESTPGADTCEGARPWSLCRLRAIVSARMRSILEVTREKAGNVHGWIRQKTHGCGYGRRPHIGVDGDEPRRHHRHHKNHGPHGEHKYHRLRHMVHQTIRFFVIPALLGVIGGLAASALGMLVGQIIVLIWIRGYRAGRRGPLRVVEREVMVSGEEKEGLLAEEKEVAPPVYEDAPRYEEAVAETVIVSSEDEKH